MGELDLVFREDILPMCPDIRTRCILERCVACGLEEVDKYPYGRVPDKGIRSFYDKTRDEVERYTTEETVKEGWFIFKKSRKVKRVKKRTKTLAHVVLEIYYEGLMCRKYGMRLFTRAKATEKDYWSTSALVYDPPIKDLKEWIETKNVRFDERSAKIVGKFLKREHGK